MYKKQIYEFKQKNHTRQAWYMHGMPQIFIKISRGNKILWLVLKIDIHLQIVGFENWDCLRNFYIILNYMLFYSKAYNL